MIMWLDQWNNDHVTSPKAILTNNKGVLSLKNISQPIGIKEEKNEVRAFQQLFDISLILN